jgi:hypothetical protein
MNVQRMIIEGGSRRHRVAHALRAGGTHDYPRFGSCKPSLNNKMNSIKIIKIHPAVGIARLGNGPSGFFISRELPGPSKRPTGGNKDFQGYRLERHLGTSEDLRS